MNEFLKNLRPKELNHYGNTDLLQESSPDFSKQKFSMDYISTNAVAKAGNIYIFEKLMARGMEW